MRVSVVSASGYLGYNKVRAFQKAIIHVHVTWSSSTDSHSHRAQWCCLSSVSSNYYRIESVWKGMELSPLGSVPVSDTTGPEGEGRD